MQRGGNYSCVATNVNGPHPAYFQVTVNRDAEIVIQPETTTTGDFNFGLTLICVGHGTPLPAITWFRDGDPIMNSSSDATIFDTMLQQGSIDFASSSLELCPLQRAGNYSCVASNANSSDPVYFQVLVNRAAELVLHPEDETSANYGSTLSVTCIGQGFPLPAIAWFRDGLPILNSSIDATIFDTALEQGNVTFSHSILEICPLQRGGN